MGGKIVLSGMVMMCMLVPGRAWSQAAPPKGNEVLPTPRAMDAPAQAPPNFFPDPKPGAPTPTYLQESQPVSSWIMNHRDCCSGKGYGSPIMSELYTVFGASIPVGGEVGRQLSTGYIVGGGGRLLLFNKPQDSAWTIDAGITNTENHSDNPTTTTLKIIEPNALVGIPTLQSLNVRLKTLNRTTFNLAFGRERYLWGSAGCGESLWRVGWDFGGRYGTESATFFEIPHRTDVISGLFVTVHSDVEFPCSRCTFVAGFRAQYGYTWSDIMQGTSDVADLNFMFTVGFRF